MNADVVLTILDQAGNCPIRGCLEKNRLCKFVIIPHSPEDVLFDVFQFGESVARIVAREIHQNQVPIFDKNMCFSAKRAVLSSHKFFQLRFQLSVYPSRKTKSEDQDQNKQA